MARIIQQLLLAALIAGAAADGERNTCDGMQTVKMDTDKIVLLAIGDWGRVGAQASLWNPFTVQNCPNGRVCCSSAQVNTYPNDFDETDIDDVPQQENVASLADEICGKVGCQAVLGLGDNFYPCGADDPRSGLNRFQSDWQQVYNIYPNLKKLKWYQIVGNHDYGFNQSTARQIAYSKQNSQWVMPNSYYATRFQGKDFSFQLYSLDATPFVQSYTYPKTNFAYHHDEYIARAVPEYINSAAPKNATNGLCTVPDANADFITNIPPNAKGQIPWLKKCMENSDATWNAIQAHFALWGSDQQYGDPNANAKKFYPGMCGAWASVQALVNKTKPAFYINGHDHTMTHADPLHNGQPMNDTAVLGYGSRAYKVNQPYSTQYFTFGNGGALAYGDGATPESPKDNNDFSSVIYNNNFENAAGEGFGIITITKCSIKIDQYAFEFYQRETAPVHTVLIPGPCYGKN